MLPALRLTDLLAGVRLFTGPVAPPPGVGGAQRAPRLPADVERSLDDLAPSAAAWVRDPSGAGQPPPLWSPRVLRLPGGAVARQVSATTCGAAVLAILALAGDARLALRLARAPEPAAAFADAQLRLHRASTRGPFGLPGWPRGLGTPPWGAAREARFGAVRYTHRVIGPGAAEPWAAIVQAAVAGVPVPLYTGGDLSAGAARAVPRHVVLLTAVQGVDAGAGPGHGRGTAHPEATATLYEPSSGSLHTLPLDVLLSGAGEDVRAAAARTRALGGWPHVVWAVLPCATA